MQKDITETLAYKIEQLWLRNTDCEECQQFVDRLAIALKVSPHHLYEILTNLCIVVNPLNK